MNPVQGYQMLNFLQWLAKTHPEIRNLDKLPLQELLDLVNEHENERLIKHENISAWQSSFYVLFHGKKDDEYEQVRRELKKFENKSQWPFG